MSKALEELNNLNNENIVYVHKEYWNEIQKNLKTLEIIKEKFRILEPIGFDVKKNSIAFGCIIQKKDLTKEEYELLKEVLLCKK